MIRRIRGLGGIAAVGEQLAYSASNIALIALGVRALGAGDASRFALLTIFLQVGVSLARSGLGLIVLIQRPQPTARAVVSDAVVVGAVAGAVCFLAANFLGFGIGVQLGFAVAALLAVVQDSLRHILFVNSRWGRVTAASVTWLVVMVVTYVLLGGTLDPAALAVISWGVGCGAALLVADPPSLRAFMPTTKESLLAQSWAKSRHLVIEQAMSLAAPGLTLLVAGIWLGQQQSGELRVAMAAVAPAAVVLQGVTTFLTPKYSTAVQDGGDKRSIAAQGTVAGIVTALVAASTLVVYLVIGRQVGSLVFGEIWSSAHSLGAIALLPMIVAATRVGWIAFMRAIAALALLRKARQNDLVIQVTATLVGSAFGPTGFLYGVLVGALLSNRFVWRRSIARST